MAKADLLSPCCDATVHPSLTRAGVICSRCGVFISEVDLFAAMGVPMKPAGSASTTRPVAHPTPPPIGGSRFPSFHSSNPVVDPQPPAPDLWAGYVPIRGRTFAVKERLKLLKCRWNSVDRVWMAPAAVASAASWVVSTGHFPAEFAYLEAIAAGADASASFDYTSPAMHEAGHTGVALAVVCCWMCGKELRGLPQHLYDMRWCGCA